MKWYEGWKSQAVLINKIPFKHDRQTITGKEIKEYVKQPANYGVWLQCDDAPDREIGDNESVNLTKHNRSKFFTGPKETVEG